MSATLPAPTSIFHNHGTSFNIVGDNAVATQQVLQQGIDPAALAPLLATLQDAISKISHPDAKQDCNAHLTALAAEVKAPAPDKSKIKGLLDTLMNAPKYIEGGTAVVDAAAAVLNWVTPLLK